MKTKNLIMTIVLVSLLFFSATHSVHAGLNSALVNGYIVDETGAPVVGATVEWKDNSTGGLLESTTSVSEGYYFMSRDFDDTIESLIVASKTCYITNSTVISTTGAFPPNIYENVNLTLAGDTEPPVITALQPPDDSFTNDSTPTISANYSDDSGINMSSVEMRIDGNIVTPGYLSETGVSYTPEDDLDEGLHTVMVNVSDLCGNPNSTSWAFTVDTIPPSIEFIEPPTPLNNSEVNVSYVNVSVNVTDYSSGIDNATVVMVWNETGYPMTEYMYAFTEGKYYCVVSNLENGNYTYWVQADDFAGNMRVSETRIVTVNVTERTVNVTLEYGWNMFGVPLNVSAWALPAVLSSIEGKYDYVYYYNATSDGMDYFVAAHPEASTLTELEPLAGYLVDISVADTLQFEAKKFVAPSRDLESGWNMFSVPYGVVDKTLPTVLSSIEGKYDYVYYYNATTGGMDYYVAAHPEASTLTELEPGVGYLINMIEADVFIPTIGGE
ncbi:carboxypeptidase regulatory-like domain-containing protein [candidate division WOR-3 bacterium]|nr:carboxypeptidase regulatory-like domain-containing protein [candidate division WOR-3 bacterium]